jgi:probable rRNA maturation factor
MFQVEISNQQTFIDIDENYLVNVVTTVCEKEKVVSASINLAFLDDPSIRVLNSQYLDHDYETDVLSFLMECRTPKNISEQEATELRGFGKEIEGDVIVSAEMAQNCAIEYGWKPHDELILYIIHGVLHLLGYDDLSYDEKLLMRKKEKEYLNLFNLSPKYRSDDLELDPKRTDTLEK